MESLFLCLIGSLISILLVYIAFEINIKNIKTSINNKKIKELVDKFPENEEICRSILKMIKNENVKIKQNENDKDKTSVYVVLTDTIFIANIKDIHTRIQTIAHECIHSIQSRKMLLFNFFYTNIYNLYFFVAIILTIFRIYKNYYIQIIILLLMGIVFFVVRSYLENDAMIKAKYLANEYMIKYNKENNICTENQINEITQEYDNLNKKGIPTYNFILFLKILSKIIIYLITTIIVNLF